VTEVASSEGGEVRPAAVAGVFYPAEAAELRDHVMRFVETAADRPGCVPVGGPSPAGSLRYQAVPENTATAPSAVIAPHAGYRYSGPTAGYAYQALAARRDTVERVVVVGPAHRVPFAGIGVTSARAWSTPLGDIDVDAEARDRVRGVPDVVDADDAHAPEHSIEVQLPFVREVLGPVPVLPLVVGRTTPDAVARALDAVWTDDNTVVIASSDLSHYLDDETARQRDQHTAEAIIEARRNDIGPRDACGALPIAGLLTAALKRGLAPQLLDLSTSADTAGEPARVVGYGSFALLPSVPPSHHDRMWLLDLASRAIAHELWTGHPYPLDDPDVPVAVRSPAASFVTLTRGDTLIGCIGSLEPQRALWRDVAHNARAAAFEDPRFAPLTLEHVAEVTIEVSVLSPLEEVPAVSPEALASELRPGRDGVVLAAEGRRGTFLPDVWERLPEPMTFVSELARKARWEQPWINGARAWRYTTHAVAGPAEFA
jgi:MEMO1 family protein